MFITHGGLLSIQESIYHGVKVLGMPLYGDQIGNMKMVEMQGWGKMFRWEDLTYENFRDAIVEIIKNKK